MLDAIRNSLTPSEFSKICDNTKCQITDHSAKINVSGLHYRDLNETLKGYLDSKTRKEKAWYIRLLFGSQKNEFGIHKAMYSQEMLSSLLKKHGYRNIQNQTNVHFYPAFALEAIKK